MVSLRSNPESRYKEPALWWWFGRVWLSDNSNIQSNVAVVGGVDVEVREKIQAVINYSQMSRRLVIVVE